MKKRIVVFSCILLAFSFIFSVSFTKSTNSEKIIASAGNSTFALGEIVSSFMGSESEDALGNAIDGITMDAGVGSKISNVFGEVLDGMTAIDFGDVVDGLGNFGSGILGGLGNAGKSNTTEQPTYDIQTILPMVTLEESAVPAGPQTETQQVLTETVITESTTYGLTVDMNASEVPYEKPTDEINPGDEGDAVRWIQWVFIYSDYGLRPDGITGVMDDDTVALVKKLQQENGFMVDGVVTPEVLDKIELLYLSKSLGEGNTGQFIQPSATVENETNVAAVTDDSDNKLIIVIIIIAVLWILTLATITTVFVMKKKKTEKAVKDLESSEKNANNEVVEKTEQSKNTSKKEISGMSDLFEEANSKKK